jgi:primosomal protein N' (replication factor Y)
MLLEKGYAAFASELLIERQSLQLPPYSYQALIRAEAKTLKQALHFLQQCKMQAQKIKRSSVTLSGPVPATMEKRQGRYRAQLLIQSKKRAVLQELLSGLMPYIHAMPASQRLRWSMDVDPMEGYS